MRDTKYSAAVGGICAILIAIIVSFAILNEAIGTTGATLFMFGPTAVIAALVWRHVRKERSRSDSNDDA